MPYAYRAIALDYDGTLTESDRPSDDVLAALREVREGGKRVILVTGRVLSELRAVFPDVSEHFDAIVAENGGVIALGDLGAARALATAVPALLAAVLERRGVPVRRGQVLLATDAIYDDVVFEEITRLGLEVQIVHNRSALMVLPPGVNKGTGLHEALGELGISHHSCVAVGDAENDHSLIEHAEVGIAVANAVPALTMHADVVLAQQDGTAIAALLRGPLLRGEIRIQPRRWQIEIGTDEWGRPVMLPASQINVLIGGASGSGKSYAGGLFAERVMALGYSCVVLDAEGDHVGLAGLRGVVRVGGGEPLPSVDRLAELARHRFGSVVVDLSRLGLGQRASYCRSAVLALQAERSKRGIPHWIVVDEAHVPLGIGGAACSVVDPSQKGLCIVTFLPGQLCERILTDVDVLVALGGDHADGDALRPLVRAIPGASGERFTSAVAALKRGQAVMIRREAPQRIVTMTLAARHAPHVRHWTKYARAMLPENLHFRFRRNGALTGRVATNVEQLHAELGSCDDAVLRHHAGNGDIGRWIAEALQDRDLAESVRGLERGLDERGAHATRGAIRAEIEKRYLC